MRLEQLQIQDTDGNPQIRRMVEVLPSRLSQTADRIELKSNWFSGCMPLGYLFIAIAAVHGWAVASKVETSGITGGVIVACLLIVVELLMAVWMFSKQIGWKIDHKEIRRRRMLPQLFADTCWSSESVTSVIIVEQGTFTLRYQNFAPGIVLKTESGSIDLGAHPRESTVHDIGRALSELLEVPLEIKTREGIFDTFRSGKKKLFLIAIAIAIALIALRWWFEHR